MVTRNDLDHFCLLDWVPHLEPRTAALRQQMVDAHLDGRPYGRLLVPSRGDLGPEPHNLHQRRDQAPYSEGSTDQLSAFK